MQGFCAGNTNNLVANLQNGALARRREILPVGKPDRNFLKKEIKLDRQKYLAGKYKTFAVRIKFSRAALQVSSTQTSGPTPGSASQVVFKRMGYHLK